MQARDVFHKAKRPGISRIFAVFAVLAGLVACNAGDAAPATGSAASVAPAGDGAARAPSTPALPPAGHAWVIFGADTVLAEVAASPEERNEGLMYRDEVPDGTGMIFVFQDSQVRSFWMANTYVPLDIAYMDAAYRIVDMVAMEPLDTQSVPSKAPAMFALEVRQGWFEEHGIAVGAQAEIVFGVRGG